MIQSTVRASEKTGQFPVKTRQYCSYFSGLASVNQRPMISRAGD